MAENNTNAPLIETSAVGFTYQGSETPALQDVTLSIGAGECVLLCGKSGCGKTTFTRLLNGLAPAFFPGRMLGSCRVGDLLAGTAAIEEYVPLVGSVFQNPKTQYFNVDTTAELAFPCENVGMPSTEIRSRVQDCARRFGLTGLMDRSIFRLSGGEKQRIAFATASMLGPRLLVLDEPTSNLDAGAIVQLHDMIAAMKEAGVTIVLAEHRLAWITDLADRYFFFEEGCRVCRPHGEGPYRPRSACPGTGTLPRPLEGKVGGLQWASPGAGGHSKQRADLGLQQAQPHPHTA